MAIARAAGFGWQPRHAPAAAMEDYAGWLLANGDQGLR
jgi:hypothetical protein